MSRLSVRFSYTYRKRHRCRYTYLVCSDPAQPSFPVRAGLRCSRALSAVFRWSAITDSEPEAQSALTGCSDAPLKTMAATPVPHHVQVKSGVESQFETFSEDSGGVFHSAQRLDFIVVKVVKSFCFTRATKRTRFTRATKRMRFTGETERVERLFFRQ